MNDIERILIAVDPLNPRQATVTCGVSLALQFKAKLLLTYIVPSAEALVYSAPTANYAFSREIAYAKATLPFLVPRELRRKLTVETIVRVGAVAAGLRDIVDEYQIDLVVMGTPRRHTLQSIFASSATERMQDTVPVLTVPDLDSSTTLSLPGRGLTHVAYATDLSDNDELGLNAAVELARRYRARLSVLHVLRPLIGELGFNILGIEDRIEDTSARLQFQILRGMRDNIEITPVILEGSPFREILRFIEQENADLLVINRRTRSALQRALRVSTGDQLIRRAAVPILSLPFHGAGASRNRDLGASAKTPEQVA